MRKLIAITLSLLMVFTTIPMAIISASAEETAYEYVTIEDFESFDVGKSFQKNKAVSSRINNGWNATSVITDNTDCLNPNTQSTKGIRFIQDKLTYNNGNAAFCVLNMNSALLANSYGFRFWLDGDETCYGTVVISYSVTLNGKTENYKTQGAVSYKGNWVTVLWGNLDSSGLRWYHNGTSAWKNEVLPRETMTSLSSLSVSIGSTVTANKDPQNFYIDDIQMIKEPTPPVTMKSGAAIRLNEQNGIRFYTTVDTAKLEALKAVEGNVVELGTLIAPADLVTGELTHSIGADNYVDVPYKNDTYFEDTTFVGSIVGIKPGNIGRKFIGRGYIKVTNGETETYYYATQNDNERSLKSVAASYQGTDDYNSKTDEVKELVDTWASVADWSAQ